MSSPTCPKCGAPVSLVPDGDPHYDPPATPMKVNLSKAGKEELAIALILWKDFKSQGKWDAELTIQMLEFGKRLDIYQELESMIPRVPRMTIKPT